MVRFVRMLLGLALASWVGFVTPVWADEVVPVVVDLEQGWEYRWGDSPFDTDGTPRWTRESNADDQWRPIGFPSNPPGRSGRENVWYRVPVPEGDWRDPVLYVFSIDLIVQVYLDGRMIYSYGEFDERGKGEFAGWPWHMIPLPDGSEGEFLYFRVFSNYLDIGLWGEVKIMERMTLFEYVIANSVEGLIIGGFCLLLATVALLFASMQQTQRQVFVATALYAFASGAVVLAKSPASQLIWQAPLAWDFIGAMGYFAIPVAMALLLEQWFSRSVDRLYRTIWRFFLMFLLCSALVSAMGWVPVSTLYPIFDLLFAGALVALFVPALRFVREYSADQKLILSALGVLSLLLLIDMAVAHGFLPWDNVPVAWGSLVFLLAVIWISLRFFVRTQKELRQLNVSLEKQVRARTVELERLSYEDALTGLKNRRFFDEVFEREVALSHRESLPISVLICDLDKFKVFNDTHGHSAGDEALRHVARVLTQVFRQTDLICRYGGEEFVVIMPGADGTNAMEKAEQLRYAVAADSVTSKGAELGYITLSVGVASWPGIESDAMGLLSAADQALYRAKRYGRDRVEVAMGESAQAHRDGHQGGPSRA